MWLIVLVLVAVVALVPGNVAADAVPGQRGCSRRILGRTTGGDPAHLLRCRCGRQPATKLVLARLATRTSRGLGGHRVSGTRVTYWRAMATRSRSSGLMRWSASSAASPMSICTHAMRPLKRLVAGV